VALPLFLTKDFPFGCFFKHWLWLCFLVFFIVSVLISLVLFCVGVLLKGKLIVIEGTDGSGKTTQSKRLLQRLEESGFLTAYVDFPKHGEKSSGMVDNYLTGKYGSANEVDPKIASMFYAVDRYDSSFDIRKALSEGRVIISNRYVTASIGHQACKISDTKKRHEFIDWLEDTEYNFFGIPRPDLVILLFVPYSISKKLVESKGKREYIGSKKDIHESDASHILSAEKTFLEIAKEKNWSVVDCTKGGNILSIEEINNKVFSIVKGFLEESK